jgi:hypothetical protein
MYVCVNHHRDMLPDHCVFLHVQSLRGACVLHLYRLHVESFLNKASTQLGSEGFLMTTHSGHILLAQSQCLQSQGCRCKLLQSLGLACQCM